MSAGEPFARVEGGRMAADIDALRHVRSYVVVVAGRDVCQHPVLPGTEESEAKCEAFAKQRSQVLADELNAAVSARERAAAERALRDLAEAWAEARAEEEPWTTGFGLREAVERLHARADAIRDGRAT